MLKAAVLIDAGFAKKRLQRLLKRSRHPGVDDFIAISDLCMKQAPLQDYRILRTYVYDAPPFEGSMKHPITGVDQDFGASEVHNRMKSLLDSLEQQPKFAVRRGSLVGAGWKLGSRALKNLAGEQRPIGPSDLVPNISQKGVDMRIGLDIAWMSLKRVVDGIVLVTGDTDFVPAMKLARREGLTVFLQTLGHPVRAELKGHSDHVLDSIESAFCPTPQSEGQP